MTARLTSIELREAISLLATQLYQRAARTLDNPNTDVTATVATVAGGVVRMRLEMSVDRPAPSGSRLVAANDGRPA